MKKVFIVLEDKDVLPALEKLRDMGVLHVEHAREPAGQSVHELREKEHLLMRALDILCLEGKCRVPQELAADAISKAREIVELMEHEGRLQDEVNKRQGLVHFWEGWGDFDPGDIKALEDKGVYLRLVEVPRKDFDKVPDGVVLEQVYAKGDLVRCVAISRGKPEKLPFIVLPMPPAGLRELRQAQENDRAEISRLEEGIKAAAKYADSLGRALVDLRQDINFREVYAGRGQEGGFAFLQGFCPADRCQELDRSARKENWGILIADPAGDEPVPTLLRDPKWVESIKPLFRWLNIFPGYREMDISLVFLIFFSLFFGILIGDAGYGLIYAGLTAIAQAKIGRKVKDKSLFFLLYLLSGVTVVWGLLTATFFGQAWLPAKAKFLMVPWLMDQGNFQLLCFIIGAVHLSIAHIWRGVRKMPSLAFISDIGWLIFLWGMFFVANMFVLGRPLPGFAKILLLAGPVLVIFFAQPGRNILKSVGLGAAEFVGNAVNTFTDIISYIRLYAVSLASVAIADAFNDLAAGFGFNSVMAGLIAGFILVLGHSLNIVLGPMAILVHGLRLNVLEFSSHLSLEWKGFPYNPFRKAESSKV